MTPDTAVPASEPKPRKNSPQDRQMEKSLVAVEQLIGALQAEPPDIAAELAEGGYTKEALTATALEQKAAFSVYVAQGEAEHQQKTTTKAFLAAEKSARTFYRVLRTQGKSAFLRDPEGRGKLRLDGREPDGLKDFIGAARALVESGSKPEYAPLLARKAVTAAKLAKLSGLIDALQAADLAQETAKAAAPQARIQRDAAAQKLADWLAEFKLFAKGQFADRPELLKRWGLK